MMEVLLSVFFKRRITRGGTKVIDQRKIERESLKRAREVKCIITHGLRTIISVFGRSMNSEALLVFRSNNPLPVL